MLYNNRQYYDYPNVKTKPITEPDEKLEIVFDIDEYGTVIIPILQEDCRTFPYNIPRNKAKKIVNLADGN